MITVLGPGGFIGSHVVKRLEVLEMDYYAPGRNENIESKDLGDIVYCIGLTADFRHKPFETIEAHVCFLNKVLSQYKFNSLTYLSSTRVYINCKEEEVFEDTDIVVSINHPDELYTLSKLTGERLCLSSGRRAKIARLSNVYGSDYSSENFISDVARKIQTDKFVKFSTTPASAKDYISINSVVDLLISIAVQGKQDMYNIASGINLANDDIIGIFREHFKFDYEFDKNAKEIIFPKINIDRIKTEFGFSEDSTKNNLSQHIKTYG